MVDYKISEYSYRKAKELGVDILPAENKHKKIGVWKNGKHIVDIGAKNYKSYPDYMDMEAKGEVPKNYAVERRRLYKLRHKYDKGGDSAGFYANKILW
jgi:ribosomal protein L7/L12